MSHLTLLALLVTPSWTGEFTLTIQGSGKAVGPGPSNGDWEIRREAKGTIMLDRSFLGAGIAGSPDGKNEKRYETWISNTKQPIQMRIRDRIHLRGPLFAKNEIRDDVWTYVTPVPGEASEWQSGFVGSPTLQLDLIAGKFLWDSPRFYSKTKRTFVRKFVAGPPAWVKTKPIVQDDLEIEFEMIHGLNQPKEWFKLSGPYKTGQTEISLSRKFPFTVPLGVSIKAPKLEAELKLVLRKA